MKLIRVFQNVLQLERCTVDLVSYVFLFVNGFIAVIFYYHSMMPELSCCLMRSCKFMCSSLLVKMIWYNFFLIVYLYAFCNTIYYFPYLNLPIFCVYFLIVQLKFNISLLFYQGALMLGMKALPLSSGLGSFIMASRPAFWSCSCFDLV